MAVPGLAVALAGPEPLHLPADIRRAPVMAPFGWHEVLAVHLLAGLPLAWWLAGRIPGRRGQLWCIGAIGVGLLLAAGSLSFGGAIAAWLDAVDAGPVGRFMARLVVCLILQLPWCVAASRESPPWGMAAFAVVVALAVAPTALFTQWLAERRTARAEELQREMRLGRLYPVVDGLCAVGSLIPVNQQTPTML